MPENSPVLISVEFISVPPDMETDSKRIVKEILAEGAIFSSFGNQYEIGVEQKTPVLASIATIVATLRLPFNDIPDLAIAIKKFIIYLREKLITQVDVREIKIKTENGEILIKVKENEKIHLETDDIKVIIKKKKA